MVHHRIQSRGKGRVGGRGGGSTEYVDFMNRERYCILLVREGTEQ
jgi:hypothetical protein